MLHVRRTVPDGDCAVCFRVVLVSKSVFLLTQLCVYIRVFFFTYTDHHHISKLSLIVCEPMTGIIFTDSFHPLKVTFELQQLHESPV